MNALNDRLAYSQDIQGTASKESAERLGASGKNALQVAVLACLRSGPASADAIAKVIGRDHATVRPRLGELADAGLVKLTGETAQGAAGGVQNIWKLSRPDDVESLKAARKAARLEREKRRFAKLLVEMGVSL